MKSDSPYPPRPDLVMFDLDGTLVDSLPDLSAALDAMLLEMGYPPAGEYKARMWVGDGSLVLVRRALADTLREPEAHVSRQLQEHCLESYFRHYRHCSGLHSVLFDGVESALQLLRRHEVKLAIITNKPCEFIAPLLRDLEIYDYFDTFVGGDTLPERKPHPGPLQYVLDAQGVSPADALMVGDSANDIVAARAAGVSSVAVPYGYNHGRTVEADNPDWITDNLGDFFGAVLDDSA